VFDELAMLRTCDDSPKEAFLANTRFAGDLVEHCERANGVILASRGAVCEPSTEAWNENGALPPTHIYALTKVPATVLNVAGVEIIKASGSAY